MKEVEIVSKDTNLEQTRQIYQDYYAMINAIFGKERGYQDIAIFSGTYQCAPAIKILRYINISSDDDYSSEHQEICLNESKITPGLPSRKKIDFNLENNRFLQYPDSPNNQVGPFMQTVIHNMNEFSKTPGAYIRIDNEIKFVSDGTQWSLPQSPKPNLSDSSASLLEEKS